MAATAVNAPMMPPEVLKELQPYVALAAGLGRTAVQLVAETGFTDVSITYDSPRGDDLDTRLLRAMVIKVHNIKTSLWVPPYHTSVLYALWHFCISSQGVQPYMHCVAASAGQLCAACFMVTGCAAPCTAIP